MSDSNDEIYVGYQPVPPGYRRFLRIAVPVALWLTLLAALAIARSQRSPGQAVWDSSPVSIAGTLTVRPYPVILTDDGTAVLLVESGKHGLAGRAQPFDGQRVKVSGWPLHRDGRRMLELEPTASAIAKDPGPAKPIPSPTSLGQVVLRGEIVDSKCFLGAMKPGEGKTHKECATLCIRGGIPPMLVTYGSAGQATYTLLAGPDGGPLEAGAHPFIGDYVEVSGALFEQNGLRILQLSPAAIRRV